MEHVSLTLLRLLPPLITLTLPRELVAPYAAANLNWMCVGGGGDSLLLLLAVLLLLGTVIVIALLPVGPHLLVTL